MNDPEDPNEQYERQQREDELARERENNEDGMTDADMYKIYSPDDDGDYDSNDY